MGPELEEWRRALLERRAALLRERMGIARVDDGPRAPERTLADVLDSLGARELAHLQAIADAIVRLDGGRFGRCVDCAAEIALDRLRAAPEAARCSPCEHRLARARRHGRGASG